MKKVIMITAILSFFSCDKEKNKIQGVNGVEFKGDEGFYYKWIDCECYYQDPYMRQNKKTNFAKASKEAVCLEHSTHPCD